MNWEPVCFITILIIFPSIVCAMDGNSTNGIIANQRTDEAFRSNSVGSSSHTQTRQESWFGHQDGLSTDIEQFVSGFSAYICLRQDCESNGNIFTCSFLSYCKGTKHFEHFYDSYSSVGYVPKLEAKNLKYVFKQEKFDNNTYVQVRPFDAFTQNIVINSDIPDDRDIGQLMFTDTTDVMFDCGQHLNDSKYVYVGLINTTANKLTTMNTTTIMNRYSETYDGSILCCLFYKITGDSNEMSIERFISNKTLLRYYANEKIDNCLLIVILIATAATLIFVVVAIILIRKRCLNNNSLSRRPKLALPKKERKNPFYLNLLFRKECEQEIRAAESQKEELHYEEIL